MVKGATSIICRAALLMAFALSVIGCAPTIASDSDTLGYTAAEIETLATLKPVAESLLAERLGGARARTLLDGSEEATNDEASMMDQVAQEVLQAEFGEDWVKYRIVEGSGCSAKDIGSPSASRALQPAGDINLTLINILTDLEKLQVQNAATESGQPLDLNSTVVSVLFDASAVQTRWPFWTSIRASGVC